MRKAKWINFVKYNELVCKLYVRVFSILINILKIFLVTDDRLILFNSYAGRKCGDSPYAVYSAMKKDKRFRGYKLVWAFHEPECYQIKQAIKTDNLKYFVIAIKARVWVTNSSVERGLRFKGKNTFYLNTWHGTPLKKMGTDIAEENTSLKMNPCLPDIFCVQGEYEREIFSHAFNIPAERFLMCGLPRNDILAVHSKQQRHCIRNKLKIEKGRTVILYCPTFREYEKDRNFRCVAKPPVNLDKWKDTLGHTYFLFIRAHYETVNVMDIKDNDFVQDMSSYPSLEELMIASDLLISDYSSVFFDYSIMDKPMLCFAYDYEKYARKRGMYFDIRDYLDYGESEDEILNLIVKLNESEAIKKTRKFRTKFVNYYGNAAQQCVDCIAGHIMEQ